jgi:hypothetical protein
MRTHKETKPRCGAAPRSRGARRFPNLPRSITPPSQQRSSETPTALVQTSGALRPFRFAPRMGRHLPLHLAFLFNSDWLGGSLPRSRLIMNDCGSLGSCPLAPYSSGCFLRLELSQPLCSPARSTPHKQRMGVLNFSCTRLDVVN